MRKLTLYLILSTILLGCADEESKRDLEITENRLDSLSIVLEKEKEMKDSLQALFSRADSTVGDYAIFFGRKYDSIENPEEFIEEELLKQSDIIPLDPVLGGNMEFRKIDILTENWLLAIYDDGHIQGKAIFEYELQPNGSMKYEIIASQE